MDFGIAGRKAIICASTQGLGLACATSLAGEGVEVWINGRDGTRAREVAARLAESTGAKVHGVGADITTEHGRAALIAACPEPDILVNNNAGPPPGKLDDWGHDQWIAALEANMLAPALLIRAVVPGMRTRRFGRIVNVTSAMVKSPRPMMALSTGARTGLTAFAKSLSLDIAADNVTINNLLPERIDTDRQRFMAERMMREQDISMEEARRQIAESIAAKRFGTTREFGDACAYLCSAQAGFISGQNLQLDGGSYHGLI
ncbi:MAG: SDR family oxidoreductase [Burkholderiaceae bacterium]